MLEEEIQKMIKEEVEKVLHPLIQNIATYAETNQTQLLSLKNRLDENIKQTQELLVILKKELDATNYKNLALAIKGQPVTGTTYPKDKPPVTKEELKELEKDIDLAITKTKKTVPYKEEIGTEEHEAEPEEEEDAIHPHVCLGFSIDCWFC